MPSVRTHGPAPGRPPRPGVSRYPGESPGHRSPVCPLSATSGSGPERPGHRRARAASSAASHGPCGRTSHHLNTPFHNPRSEDVTEIEVTDPMHPLFSRRFPLISISAPTQGPGHVLVAYREHMVLRIPVQATNLAGPRPVVPTKLTLQALTEFVALAEHCEMLCHTNQKTSGNTCPPDSNSNSSRISRRSSRR